MTNYKIIRDKSGEQAAALASLYNGILVKLQDPEFDSLQINENGDWIDLKISEDVEMKAGEVKLIKLGVSMKLPAGYEAIIAPRSSTCLKTGIMQANSIAIIDNSYCGNDDIWRFCAYAIRDTKVSKGDRLCQFRILPSMDHLYDVKYLNNDPIYIIYTDDLMTDTNRGGFGTSGK